MCLLASTRSSQRELAIIGPDEGGALFSGPSGQETLHRVHIGSLGFVCRGQEVGVVWAELGFIIWRLERQGSWVPVVR